MLAPGFFASEALAALSRDHRLLFAGLWLMADRQGRSLDQPKAIAGAIFPHDRDLSDEVVDRMLADLASTPEPFILRYRAAGKACIWIPGFLRTQRPHRREKASVLPRHPSDDGTDFAPKPKKASRGTVPGPAPGESPARPRRAKDRRNTELLPSSPSSSPTEKSPGEAARSNGTDPAKPKADNWLAGYLDDWRTIRGGNLANVGAATKPLKDVHDRYGVERTRAGWRKYLTARADKEASAHWFAQDAARWCGPAPLPVELADEEPGRPSLRGWLRPADWQDGLPAYSWPCTECPTGQHAAFDKALRGTCATKLGFRVDRDGRVVA